MKKIVVVGSEGYVGSAFVRMVENHCEVVKIDVSLGDKSATYEQANQCDLGVVCVPTLMDKSTPFPHACDTSLVEEVVSKLNTPVILIKSTIKPGTTDYLSKKYNKKICMSPEYIGEGKYYMPESVNFSKRMEVTPFWIVGGNPEDVKYIYDILVPILGPVKRYLTVTAKEAEVIKYWENIALAMRVIMANEMRQSCEALDVNYYNVRDGVFIDPRMNLFHSMAFTEKPGFDGKCLPKDLNAFYRACLEVGYDPKLLKATLETNYKMRKEANLDNQYTIED